MMLMGKFRELQEFESRFETMDVEELMRWKAYWTRHAEQYSPKARKVAMRRVYDIESAIKQKGGEESAEQAKEAADISRERSFVGTGTQKARALAGRIMYVECKAGALTGAARIGRVSHSKTGRTLY